MSNMKQKIVTKVDMGYEKCRSKALFVAFVANSVNSVAIQENDRDELVVIGEGIDSAGLAKFLRKKVGYATLVSVQPVPPPPPPPIAASLPASKPTQGYPSYCPIHHPHFEMYEVVYDPYPNNNCSTM